MKSPSGIRRVLQELAVRQAMERSRREEAFDGGVRHVAASNANHPVRRPQLEQATGPPGQVPAEPGNERHAEDEQAEQRRNDEQQLLQFAPDEHERLACHPERRAGQVLNRLADEGQALQGIAHRESGRLDVRTALPDRPTDLGESRQRRIQPIGDDRPEADPDPGRDIGQHLPRASGGDLAPELHRATPPGHFGRPSPQGP